MADIYDPSKGPSPTYKVRKKKVKSPKPPIKIVIAAVITGITGIWAMHSGLIFHSIGAYSLWRSNYPELAMKGLFLILVGAACLLSAIGVYRQSPNGNAFAVAMDMILSFIFGLYILPFPSYLIILIQVGVVLSIINIFALILKDASFKPKIGYDFDT